MDQNIDVSWNERRIWLFVFLAGLFITNAVTAELISNKLIEIPISFGIGDYQVGPFLTIVGILPWPIVFLLTDILNEFYGPKVVRRFLDYCYSYWLLFLNRYNNDVNSGI